MHGSKRPRAKEDRSAVRIYGIIIVLSVIGFAVAWLFVEPAPPDHVVMATGLPEGAYHAHGVRYRDALALEGITLELRTTSGADENLVLLKKGEVDVALVQSGIATISGGGSAMALASLYYEPCWVFTRTMYAMTHLTQLQSGSIAVGPPGSGTRAVASILLRHNGIDVERRGRPLAGLAAADALLKGEVDAAFFVGSASAPYIRKLVAAAPSIRLADFARTEAYCRRYRWLSSVVYPEGVHDFAANLPPEDARLLAPAANLVAKENLHPALIDLLMRAATATHRDGGLFEAPGDFPSPRFTDLPVSEPSRRYMKDGEPFLQRVLPFWLANFLERMKILIVPLLTLLIPLFKIIPPTWRWSIRSRIYKAYRELRAIDLELEADVAADVRESCRRRLDAMEHGLDEVTVPLAYTDNLYNLRLHIDLVRKKAEGGAGAG